MRFQRPGDYPPTVARALAAYQDDDLQRGEDMLECWGLMHACFRGSDALEFQATNIHVKEGRGLNELKPAPEFADLWKKTESAPILLELTAGAKSRLVRVWSMELLRGAHASWLAELDPEKLIQLLDHADGEVQQFGAEALQGSNRLATLTIGVWLKLLETNNPTALAIICETMRRTVTSDRLDLAQCVQLSCAKATPVARLGFEFLRTCPIDLQSDRERIVSLADARLHGGGGRNRRLALGLLGTPERYDRDEVIRFFDSLQRETRGAAWNWLEPESPGYDDPLLWSRLLETPFDDVRHRLIETLARRAALPGCDPSDLTSLWCAVLLGVHRGGRQKQQAVAQVGQAILASPDRAELLLPVLAVAIRSVRAPERRAGLAAVVSAVERRPELAAAVAAHLPELKFLAPEATA